MSTRDNNRAHRLRKLSCLTVAFVMAVSVLVASPGLSLRADAAVAFNTTSVMQSRPEPGATSNVMGFSVTGVPATNTRCVAVQFGIDVSPTALAPPGLDLSQATFATSGSLFSTWSGWTTSVAGGVIRATNSPGATPQTTTPGPQVQLTNVTNGTNANTSYAATLTLYSDTGCSNAIVAGSTRFNWSNDVTVSLAVDPAITFTVAGRNSGTCNGATITGTASTSDGVSLGRVEPDTMAVGGQDLSVTTNAARGYSVFARLDHALDDGAGHTIASIAADTNAPMPFPAPGTEAFGYTTSSPLSGIANRFSSGGTKWAAVPSTDVEVASATGLGSSTNCVAYGITIGQQTVSGRYEATVFYNLVPRF